MEAACNEDYTERALGVLCKLIPGRWGCASLSPQAKQERRLREACSESLTLSLKDTGSSVSTLDGRRWDLLGREKAAWGVNACFYWMWTKNVWFPHQSETPRIEFLRVILNWTSAKKKNWRSVTLTKEWVAGSP